MTHGHYDFYFRLAILALPTPTVRVAATNGCPICMLNYQMPAAKRRGYGLCFFPPKGVDVLTFLRTPQQSAGFAFDFPFKLPNRLCPGRKMARSLLDPNYSLSEFYEDRVDVCDLSVGLGNLSYL